MSSEVQYRRFAILFVDDETQSQKYFSQIFGETFNVIVASDGDEAWDVFQERGHEIGVIVSDQRMPRMSGSEFLAKVSEHNPRVVNILSTAYSDLDAAISAVNEGGIYRYVTKPWDLPELDVTLRRAMEYFLLQEQVHQLSVSKIAGLEKMFCQSRLLACAAIPSLINESPALVRAFRDLLRFALKDEVAATASGKSKGREDFEIRSSLLNQFKETLKTLVSQAGEGGSGTAEEFQEELTSALGKGEDDRLVGALFALIQDRAGEEDLKIISTVLRAYQSGLILQLVSGNYIVEKAQYESSATVMDELLALFVEDEFLVSCVLHEMEI